MELTLSKFVDGIHSFEGGGKKRLVVDRVMASDEGPPALNRLRPDESEIVKVSQYLEKLSTAKLLSFNFIEAKAIAAE